ncbi:protein DOG1-like 4 [Carica papaya]|uniref:protein DOG1-like 4 n=1 Tax=Carica papaya TaxID=3649 RepID=UPI000B8CE149|nr:protein DOG1-like 4 [Carica papaya]
MKGQVGERFGEFYEKWVSELDECWQQLLRVSKERSLSTNSSGEEEQIQALVSKLTAHYKQYYTVKWVAAHEDVLAFFCPMWLSSVEIAYSWVTGWRPCMMFRMVESMRKTREPGLSLAEMTDEQVKKMEELRGKIRIEEERVEREMERLQVVVADKKMVELVKLQRINQVEALVEVALKGLTMGLERVVKAADCVRLKTLKGVLDILSPLQCVNFLAGTCLVHIQLRQQGNRRDTHHDQ